MQVEKMSRGIRSQDTFMLHVLVGIGKARGEAGVPVHPAPLKG